MKQPLYLTPRALLIKYLNEKSHPEVAHWIQKGVKCHVNPNTLIAHWAEQARENKLQHIYSQQIVADFLISFVPGLILVQNVTDKNEFFVVTKSFEKRIMVNDLVPGPLHEWIMKFLLEQTRTNWVDWTDKDNYQFQINNISGMSKEYAKANGIKTVNPLFHMKLYLAGYCATGIFRKIDKTSHIYEFNREWYEKEVKREVDGVDDPTIQESDNEHIILSRITYPHLTTDRPLPCCSNDHPV